MNLCHARRIISAAADRGHDLSLIEQYSGRLMYGQMTAAVTGKQASIVLGIAAAATELAFLAALNETTAGLPEVEDFLRAVERLRWDNMGFDVVAY